MAAADYALCDLCLGKVFYDADTDIPVGTVTVHPECAVKAFEARGYRKAIEDLRDSPALSAARLWSHEAGRLADYLESRLASLAATPVEETRADG